MNTRVLYVNIEMKVYIYLKTFILAHVLLDFLYNTTVYFFMFLSWALSLMSYMYVKKPNSSFHQCNVYLTHENVLIVVNKCIFFTINYACMNYQNDLSQHSKTSNIWKWKEIITITESNIIHYIKSALVKVQWLDIFKKRR